MGVKNMTDSWVGNDRKKRMINNKIRGIWIGLSLYMDNIIIVTVINRVMKKFKVNSMKYWYKLTSCR